MPKASETSSLTLKNPCLEYSPFGTPLDPQPQFIIGQNVRTSLKAFFERRPGFASPLESTLTNFLSSLDPNSVLSNMHVWRRWDDPASGATRGYFFCMLSVTNKVVGRSQVFKLRLGLDTSFALLYSDLTTSDPFYFVESNNTCYYSNAKSATSTRKFDGTNDNLWGIVSPSVAPAVDVATAGSLTGYVGYCYVYTYWNGTHESSPSALSVCSGIFTSKLATLTLTGTTDLQVTQARVYRTTDGGSTNPTDMREVSGSPFNIPTPGSTATFTVTEQTADTSLSSRVAPASLRNDPPPPMKGLVHTNAGRIVGFAANRVYYTGFEEIANGVPEECVPSGLDGNFFPYDGQVTAVGKLENGVAVFTADSIYGIDGDTLDTLRRYVISDRQGTRSHFNVCSYGGSLFWYDTMGSVWQLGGNEIGVPIRSDIKGLDETVSHLTIHLGDEFRWLCLLDPANSRMFVYDFDTSVWMTPWTTAANCIHSGETSVGNYDLLIGAKSGGVLKMTPTAYNDGGTPYAASVTTNLWDIAPKENSPGVPDHVFVKSNATQPTSVKLLLDEDPQVGTPTYVDISANQVDADLRVNGTNLVEKYYKAMPDTGIHSAQYCSIQMTWAAVDSGFRVYGFGLVNHGVTR